MRVRRLRLRLASGVGEGAARRGVERTFGVGYLGAWAPHGRGSGLGLRVRGTRRSGLGVHRTRHDNGWVPAQSWGRHTWVGGEIVGGGRGTRWLGEIRGWVPIRLWGRHAWVGPVSLVPVRAWKGKEVRAGGRGSHLGGSGLGRRV